MKMLILFLFMLSSSLCCAKTPETTGIIHPDESISTCLQPTSGSIKTPSNLLISGSFKPMLIDTSLLGVSCSLTIQTGDGWIKINGDGRVELENVTPDKAAQEFWKRVSDAFPQFKENILREAAEQATRKEGGFFITVPGKGL